MSITITCSKPKRCGFTTDIELTSDTNPFCCPDCGGELLVGNIKLYGRDGEYNKKLFANDE